MKNLSTQVATTREQSERLLAMGVKPETADMYAMYDGDPYCITYTLKVKDVWVPVTLKEDDYPTWSLSRLISMMPEKIIKGRKVGDLFISNTDIAYFSFESDGKLCFITGFSKGDEENVFDICIDMIDLLIKLHHFNEEYYGNTRNKV